MKVFISWSGKRSKAIAEALRDWLPSVVPSVRPWLSIADIDKGTRWRDEIAEQLEQCRVGIICLTPENLSSHWLLFEAGALSKIQGQSYICTFLHELAPTDVKDPLAQFQHTIADKEDIKNLVMTINRAQGEHANPEAQVEKVFKWGWDELSGLLQAVPTLAVDSIVKRSDGDMIEEILELVRAQTRIERTNLNDSRLVEFRMPGGVTLSVEDIELLSNYCRSLQIEQQSFSKELEKLRTDEQYVLKCLRMFRDRETKYFDKEWPSKPLLRKFPDE